MMTRLTKRTVRTVLTTAFSAAALFSDEGCQYIADSFWQGYEFVQSLMI